MAAMMMRCGSLVTRQQAHGDVDRPARIRQVNRALSVRARGMGYTPVHGSRTLTKRGDTLRAAAWPMDWLKEQASKFTQVEVDEDKGVLGGGRVGPPALLLLGFDAVEVTRVEMILKDLDGEFVQVKVATEEMMRGTLEQALDVEQTNPATVKPAANVSRIMFLSGLTTGELVQVMDEVRDAGLPMPACAAAVPMSMGKLLTQLTEEIDGDHREVLAMQAAAQSAEGGAVAPGGMESALGSYLPAALWLLAAEGDTGYSKGSYNVTLGLFLFALPGLWSLIKRSTKSKVVQKTFVTPGPAAGGALDELARKISTYFFEKNYKIKEAGETVTFEGAIAASKGQAAALTFYAFIGLLCTALVVSIATDLGDNAYLMVLLSPGAWFYYMGKAERVEEVAVKMVTNDADTETEVIIRGDAEEVERFWKTLELREKGMEYVEGLL
uniref:Uncharacterized protein n=1 Tax=Pyramimonas obovata TaxID=1411642 RepID=A0A7S0RYJ8_9CHLO